MVYINLSVHSIEESANFYANKLGIFDVQADTRLICKIGIDLILDLWACGSDRHRVVFGQDGHSVSSFSIYLGPNLPDYREIKLEILEQLDEHKVVYETTKNLGGHRIRLTDPSGNKFEIAGSHGLIT
jgi:hypothetical protein